MSYPAVEVELRDGRLIARGKDPLPVNATGLLVILSDEASSEEPVNGEPEWLKALAEIRAAQALRKHVPRSAEAVARQIEEERESWD
jgi:hypothetical protein